MAVPLLVSSNPVFANYAFYAALMGGKMLYLGVRTAVERISRGKFSNPEDVASFYNDKKAAVHAMDPDDRVERIRKNHLNDLENIPVFWVLGLLYVLIDPTPNVALWHFRVFAFSRLAHTFVYQWAIPQPARAATFGIGMAVNLSMAFQIMKFFW